MKAGQFNIENALKGSTGTIILTGMITAETNAANMIRAAIDALNQDQRVSEIEMEVINCYGGSVYEGVGTLHYMDESPKPINTKGVGIVASMAFPIFLAGKKRTMVRGSRIMSHEVKGGIMGSAEQIESYSKEVKQMNDELKGRIAEMTGKDATYVTGNLMRPGVDTYLTADECYKLGIATEKPVAGAIKADVPQNVLEHSDPQAIVNFYQQQIQNSHNPKTMEKLPLIASALGLSTDATENQVLEAAQKLANTKAALEKEKETLTAAKNTAEAGLKTIEDQRKADQETQITDMVNKAKENKLIQEGQVESLVAWGKADFVAAKSFIDSLNPPTPHQPITAQLNQGTPGAMAADGKTPLAQMSYKDLMKTEDGSKYLENLMKTDKSAFDELKKASFPGQ